ncbi:MAG: ABC transporter substrate-binding protein [Patescibacteria group bacterium]
MRNFLKFFKKTKWPSKKQWVQFFSVLSKKEKIAFLIFLGLFIGSGLFSTINFYLKHTEIAPSAGGKYIEGLVGSPRFINPIYAQGSDVDRDLVEIIFSSLVPDLTQELKILEDGRVYEITLKENIFWHDGEKLTADDVIFTVKTIQNPDYKSPLRANYLGIETQKNSDYTLSLKIKDPYSAFLERLEDLKIMPAHIWQDISPQNFLLTNYNLKPVGSGPYQFKALKQNSSNVIISLTLSKFKNYFAKDLKKPYLSEISFRFYESEADLINAAKRKEVNGFSVTSPAYFDLFDNGTFNEASLSLPRYFAIFFNSDKSKFLADSKIRQALNYAVNKSEIVQNALLNRGQVVDSPVLPDVYGYASPTTTYQFNPEKARALLEKTGLQKKDGKWIQVTKAVSTEFKSELKIGSRGAEVTALQTCLARDPEIYPEGQITGSFGAQTKTAVIRFQEKYKESILKPGGLTQGTGTVGKSTRTKLTEVCSQPPKETPLSFSLVTVNDPILEEVASLIKKQWEAVGIGVEITTYPVSQLTQDFIKPRNYEMLLFGEVLGEIPDPFPFWHSSQVKDPGLNLAKYENKKADGLLETARINLDEATRAQKYQDFQNILIADAPSVFLYRPDYVYFVDKKIKGGLETDMIVDPSERFANIENWHTNQSRSWK